MNRRFFHRVDVRANGELLWATRSRLGRVKSFRKYITTINVSVSGAKVAVPGSHVFPIHSRARLKLGLEFCDVEVLQVDSTAQGRTVLRLNFLNPSTRFITIVEKWMPISTDERENFLQVWT